VSEQRRSLHTSKQEIFLTETSRPFFFEHHSASRLITFDLTMNIARRAKENSLFGLKPMVNGFLNVGPIGR
jgi:hypothetical protein